MTPPHTDPWQPLDDALAALQSRSPADQPGFALALVHQGRVLRRVHHGMAHLEWQQPIDGRTRFYLASEAKPWVAALVLERVQAGKLALDDDVRAHLPALASYERPILLGHLLRHTSGITDYLMLWHAQLGRHAHDVITREQALALVARADEVQFAPGSRHDYSNSNYLLLAELLHRIEGADLATLARAIWFGPWGMADTDFESQPARVMPRRCRSYTRDAAGAWLDEPVPLATWGDGGLWSSLDDLIRAEQHWQAATPTAGGTDIWSRCCTDDQRFAPAGTAYRFGLELSDHPTQPLAFHGGGYAAFRSMIIRDLPRRLSLLILGNTDTFDVDFGTWQPRLASLTAALDHGP